MVTPTFSLYCSSMDLPEDCWELVFRSLGDERLFHQISLVCRRFLSISNRIRSHLHISDHRASRLFLRFANLTKITVSNSLGGLDLGLLLRELSRSAMKIEAIDLQGCRNRFPTSSAKQLGPRIGENLKSLNLRKSLFLGNDDVISIAESFPNLEFLDISYPQKVDLNLALTDSAIEVLSSKLNNLRSIHLSGNPLLTNLSLLSLSKNCSRLTEITAQDCSFINREAISFLLRQNASICSLSLNTFPSLSRDIIPKSLRHLHLSQMLVPDELLSSLVDPSIQIEDLSISYCWGLSSFSLSSFIHVHGRSLRRLVLAGLSFLSDEVMESVLPHLSRLNSISLSSSCDLRNSTFLSITKNCEWIEHIQMRKTSIGKGSSMSTSCKNTRLKSLILMENPYLDDSTIEVVARSCPNLDSLDLSSCWELTEEGLRSIGEICPKITNLCIKGCSRIQSLGKNLGLINLKSLRACGSGMNDEALYFLSHSCKGLMLLDLDGCSDVTEKGVKDVIFGCKVLQEIYVGSQNLSFNVLIRVTSSRLLLRKIVWQSDSIPYKIQDLFLRHGCLFRTRE